MRVSDEKLESILHRMGDGGYQGEMEMIHGPALKAIISDLRDIRKLARALLQKLPFYSCGCSSMESTKALKQHLEEKL